eukprot:6525593-Prymnesium_polylepis.1
MVGRASQSPAPRPTPFILLAGAPSPPRQLLVRHAGATATVDDPPRAVAGLKIAVHAKVGVPPGAQVLTFAGRVLDDDRVIDVYGILDGSTVHLALRGRGGAPLEIRGMMWCSSTPSGGPPCFTRSTSASTLTQRQSSSTA